MKHIIKAQLYQIRKTKFSFLIFIAIAFMNLIMYFGELDYENYKMSAGKYIADMSVDMLSTAVIFAIVFTGYVCGGDFIDKTSNYELMSGHTRRQVYFARAIVSIIVGTIGTAILAILPIIFGSVGYGWGTELAVGEVLRRFGLAMLVVMRMICEFVFLTYVVKNPYITMAGGYMVFMLAQLISEGMLNGDSVFLGVTCFNKLGSFESWYTYSLGNTTDMIMIYDATLSAGDIASVVVSSIGIGSLFLWLGYQFFAKDDMN
ncbi:MAG: ABC transporter permease [Clostridium sp.]|nr:ABC transporter permease [Clostridium sp.]